MLLCGLFVHSPSSQFKLVLVFYLNEPLIRLTLVIPGDFHINFLNHWAGYYVSARKHSLLHNIP